MKQSNPQNSIKSAIYCRVSSEEQKQGRTIESQIKELENFAAANNYKIAERYIDEGWSGAVIERPALDRLRDDANSGIYDAVLVNDVDRLSREMLHLGIIKKDLEKKGVKLIFRNLPNTHDPLSNFMFNVLGSFAEFERQMISDRIRRGKRYKVEERNRIMGNIPPYGYDYVPKDGNREGHYVINEEEAKIVRMMFNWVLNEGLSQRAVVRRLYEKNIPARKHARWGRSSVWNVLTNSTYIGTTYWNKRRSAKFRSGRSSAVGVRQPNQKRSIRPREEWIKINLPDNLKLIDEKVFYTVQAQFLKNKHHAKRNNKRNFYAARGLLWCGFCRSRLAGTTNHGIRYYRCSYKLKKFPEEAYCKAKLVNAEKIEGKVWEALINAMQNPEVIAGQIKYFKEKRKKQFSEAELEIKEAKTRLQTLSKEEERIFEAYRREIINMGQFKREIEKLNREKDRYAVQLKEAETQKSPAVRKEQAVRSIEEYGRLLKEKAENFTPEQKQEFIRLLIDKIIVADKKIKILGLLPVNVKNTDIPDKINHNSLDWNIMPTTIHGCERNATVRFELETGII